MHIVAALFQVAGGQEAGIVPDDDSTDYEQMLAKGEIDAEANSEDEDDMSDPAPESAPEPEPEPEPAFGEGAPQPCCIK